MSCSPALAVLLLLRMSAEAVVPPCTHDDCPQCLEDAVQPQNRRNLNIRAADLVTYAAPFRIARVAHDGWGSQTLAAQIFGILITERLGWNVEYVDCGDEVKCSYAASGCIDWAEGNCRHVHSLEEARAAHRRGRKAFPDPLADVMFLTEFREASLTGGRYAGTGVDPRNIQVMGPTGYTVVYGLYAFPEILEVGWRQLGLDLEWWEAFRVPAARSLLHSPQQLISAGVRPRQDFCTGQEAKATVSAPVSAGWTCWDSWWLNPACSAMGGNWSDQCLAVIDDGSPKPTLWHALSRSRVPTATLIANRSVWRQTVHPHRFNVTFTWWKPDATVRHFGPVRLALRDTDEPVPEIVVKAAWKTALVDLSLEQKLQGARVGIHALDELMLAYARALNQSRLPGDALFQKLACDWVRANAPIWNRWMSLSTLCPLGTYFDDAAQDCVLCPDGTKGGRNSNGTNICLLCPLGHSSVANREVCEACEPGRFANDIGSRSCLACQSGWHQPLEGQTRCEMCPSGRAAPDVESEECRACEPGFMAPNGSDQCVFCPQGTFSYSSGASACTACQAGRVTLLMGATSKSMCVCPEDTYLEVGNPDCNGCPDHFKCRDGSNLTAFAEGDTSSLSLLPGYMAIVEGKDVLVYRCLSARACPGGAPGQCGQFRDTNSVACGGGMPGTYEDQEGFHRCGNILVDKAKLVGCCLGALTGLVVFSWSVGREFHRQTNMGLLVTALCGVSFSALQTMGMFSSLSVEWFEPLRSIFVVISFVSLDLRFLHLGCIANIGPVTVYVVRQLIVPLSLPVVLVSLGAKKCYGRRLDLKPEGLNLVGSFIGFFFTSIIISAVLPFMCYPHPNNLGSSMATEPAIRCFRDASHGFMVAAGTSILVCIALPYLAVSAYGAVNHKVYLTSHLAQHARMLRGFRFLYMRFRPECHYYSLVMSLRSLSICLVPVLPGVRDDAALQFCFLSALLGCYILLQLWLKPWRASVANLADGVLMCCNLQLLVCAAINTDFTNKSSISTFGTTIFGCFCALVVGGISIALKWYLVPRPFYGHFICHHKAGAAAQARLLKVLLQERTSYPVFIDSDDLQELDNLFDTVKTKVGRLVVYLTRETLKRPWCAGEICTAIRAKKEVLVIRTPTFVYPTEMELADLGSYIDLKGCNLSHYGMEFADIAEAFRILLSDQTPYVGLPKGGTRRWKVAADAAAYVEPTGTLIRMLSHHQSKEPVPRGSVLSEDSIEAEILGDPSMTCGSVLVCCDPDSDEACASSAVIASKMRGAVMGMEEQTNVLCLCDMHHEHWKELASGVAEARSVIVVLSHNTMRTLQQLLVMVELMIAGTADVIPVRVPGFEFPEDDYFERDFPKLWPGDPLVAELHIRNFFKKIAINLEIAGSDTILARQIDDIFSRVTKTKLHAFNPIPSEIGTALLRMQAPEADDDELQKGMSASDLAMAPSKSDLSPCSAWRRKFTRESSALLHEASSCILTSLSITANCEVLGGDVGDIALAAKGE